MPAIRIFESTLELSKTAAEIFIETAKEAVHARGRFTVALTGGSSPLHLYQLLAQSPYREQVPWQQSFIFWGDERWVPVTDDKSNAKMAFENLLNRVPVPTDQIFPMWEERKPEDFARDYEGLLYKELGPSGSFDLVLLGMGDDGHTASLFPYTEVLEETEHWVKAYYLAPQQMHRITLTAPCINRARKILFLTFGEKKRNALYQVLQGTPNPEKYPAQLIKPAEGEVIWLVGKSAAQELKAE